LDYSLSKIKKLVILMKLLLIGNQVVRTNFS